MPTKVQCDNELPHPGHFWNKVVNDVTYLTECEGVPAINTSGSLTDFYNDPVNHPGHYTTGKIEVWDFIVDKGLNFLRGNVVKYVVRAGEKDPETELQDLEKARAYIDREIKRVQEERNAKKAQARHASEALFINPDEKLPFWQSPALPRKINFFIVQKPKRKNDYEAVVQCDQCYSKMPYSGISDHMDKEHPEYHWRYIAPPTTAAYK